MSLDARGPLCECVPNISEGKDPFVYNAVAEAVAAVPGANVLHVDPSPDAHRTVITFVVRPDALISAGLAAFAAAAHSIDMRKHRGIHPRIGALDVFPIVPWRGLAMADCVRFAHDLGLAVWAELHIPVYFYAHASDNPCRKRLADLRRGEYESLTSREVTQTLWPDHGNPTANLRAGASAIGARDVLIAYNLDLATPDAAIAEAIAREIRERRCFKKGPNGERCCDQNGYPLYEEGLLKTLQAKGWLVPSRVIAQVTTNLADYRITSLLSVYETASRLARHMGTTVTGAELIGMLPERALPMGGAETIGLHSPHFNRSERVLEDVLNRRGL